MNEKINFIISKLPLIFEKLLQQISLSGAAVLIACIISIPLGIVVARKTRIQKFVLATCSVFQTLPSLAVLGFLIPFLGIGSMTAIVALVFYAVLPIIRNTIAALTNLPPELLEAADGLGLTRWQKIKMIEVPLALPVIMTGIRTASAMCVGIATLAAFVGAGGLGDFIYEGLSLNNITYILLGAIPVAVLALWLDFCISRVELLLSAHKGKAVRKNYLYSIFLPIFFVGFFIFFVNIHAGNKEDHIVIGAKNFTEQLILGEIMAQLLQANTSLHIVRKFNLGGTFICHRALLNADIDIYPEYTGTAYRVLLKQASISNPDTIYDFLKKAYLKDFDVVWLPRFGFNNSNALAIRKDIAKTKLLTTISQLLPVAPMLCIGVPADFMERPDGFVGLRDQYHLHFGDIKQMDPSLMYEAIQLKQLDAIMAFSTDGRLSAYNLVVLRDDRQLFPLYQAAPLVRSQALKKHPEIEVVLNQLANKIDDRTMQALNYQVDVLKKNPEEVAAAFIKTLSVNP